MQCTMDRPLTDDVDVAPVGVRHGEHDGGLLSGTFDAACQHDVHTTGQQSHDTWGTCIHYLCCFVH